MNLFLRAKHWQIFLFTFGVPMVVQIVMVVSIMTSIFADLSSNHVPNPDPFVTMFRIFPIMMFVFTGALFGWMWSAGMGLQKMLPQGMHMRTTTFKIFFFFPLIYILFFCTFIAFAFGSMFHMQQGDAPPPAFFVGFAVIFPLHLFAMFCMFYNIYFVAKTIKSVELQREALVGDYLGEFFLVWFHFIGVWILQPRINKILANYENGTPQGPLGHFN